jgi:hypothetical protein
MKKIIVFMIMVLAVNSYSLSPFTYKWTIKLTGDTATVVKWKANNDSVLNWSSRASDTMNIKAKREGDTLHSPRIGGVASVDSVTIAKGIGGTTRMDSVTVAKGIGGTTRMDSAYVARGSKANRFYGPLTGNVTGNVTGGTVTSFTCSLYEGATLKISATAYYQIIGSAIVVYIPDLIATLSGGGGNSLNISFPSEIGSKGSMNVPIYTENAGVYSFGVLSLTAGGTQWAINNSTPFSAGTGGVMGSSLVYLKN